MKRRSMKRIGIGALSLMMLFGQVSTIYAEETLILPIEENVTPLEEGYEVSFVTDGHAVIDVYHTKDYTTPDETGVIRTFARSSKGELDMTGDGQVNFKVTVEDGYEVVSVSADKNYKNLKDSADTGVENIYRLTKITGNVTVSVSTQEIKGETPGENPGENTGENPSENPGEAPEQMGTSADIVLNEIESNGDVTDWVEIYNKGTFPVDISGWYLTEDNLSRYENRKTVPLPEGTILMPGEFLVFDQNVNFDFGLGAPDEANLFDASGNLVEKYSWSSHANGTYARVPDGTGNWSDVSTSTKGSGNKGDEVTKPTYPNAIAWPGSANVKTYDQGVQMFQSDSSGLDFYKGQLYAINNKKGTFWVMDVKKDGTMEYAKGFDAQGKNLAFLADVQNPSESNPDAEGITVDENGKAYAAVERDNNNKNVNYNVILQFDPWEEKSTVTALKEWDITNLLPDVAANAGIEAVEWVSNREVEGKLVDQNTGVGYDAKKYPNAVANGVFFVALEKNGHVYALVLNEDATAVVLADIDPGIGGAMALDYDSYEKILWVGADDGYGNVSAQIVWNGTENPTITLVNPPTGMDVTRNNEGFAIAEPEYTVNGLRPVFHFMDGVNTGVLTISYLNCNYQEPEHVHTEVTIKGSAATCTEAGTSDGIKCSTCGAWIVEPENIPATEHKDENKDGICDQCEIRLPQTDQDSVPTEPKNDTKTDKTTNTVTNGNTKEQTKNPTTATGTIAGKTGDETVWSVWLLGMLLALGIGGWCWKKGLHNS